MTSFRGTLLAIVLATPVLLPPERGAVAQSQAGRLAEADVQAFVARQQRRIATGVGSQHSSVELTFETVRVGAPRVPNAADRLEGVRGEVVYPVQVRYRALKRWGNGQTQADETHYRYDFYRDEFGDWAALSLGPVH